MTWEFWAVVIAGIAIFLTFLRDFIKPIFFKPRISIEGRNDTECIEDAISELNVKYRYLRLRLKNAGHFFSRKAKQCSVKLLWIQNEQNQRITPFTQFPLKWSVYDVRIKNLAKGESHIIDLTHEYEYKRTLQVQGSLPLSLLADAERKLGPGKYTFGIGVYGDNFSPVYKTFKVVLGKQFGQLRYC